MKPALLFLVLFQLLCAANARLNLYGANVASSQCPAPDGFFCFEGRRGPMIIECRKSSIVNSINCKKSVNDRTTTCFQSSRTSGDAVCVHGGVLSVAVQDKPVTSILISRANRVRYANGTNPLNPTVVATKDPVGSTTVLQTEPVAYVPASIFKPTRFSGTLVPTLTPGGKIVKSSDASPIETTTPALIPITEIGTPSESSIESTTTIFSTTTITASILTSLWTSAKTREVKSSMSAPEYLTSEKSTSSTSHEGTYVSSTQYSSVPQPTPKSSITVSSISTTGPTPTMSTVEHTTSSMTKIPSTSTSTTTFTITITPTSSVMVEPTTTTQPGTSEKTHQAPTVETKETTAITATLTASTVVIPSASVPTSASLSTSTFVSASTQVSTSTTTLTTTATLTSSHGSSQVNLSTSFDTTTPLTVSSTITIHTSSTPTRATPTHSIATSTPSNAADESTTDAKLAYLFGLTVAVLVLM